MNPYRLKNVFEYLTSNNQLLKRKLKLGTSEIPIPPKRDDVTAIEAINRFNKANPRVDATNIQPVVKQSNVGEPDEGVIQGAFDTATMEARDGGYPPPIYETFKKRYLKRNMKADGGRAGYEDGGMLVQPSDDGSRPGYANTKGNPKFGSKEFIEKRDAGKDIPKVRKYLNKVLRKKDFITFDSIADIKKKAGLAETSKVDADISRLLTNEYKDTVKTKNQLLRVGNTEKFRNILRDIQKTIPKGKKQFINIAFTATKNNLSGNPNSGAYSRILQEPEFNNFVVLTQDVKSNPQIIRFAEEFEKLYEIQDIDREFFGELAENIYGNKSKDSLRKVSADASKYAEFLYGVRDVTDADGKKLKLPNVETRGDYLFELLDETLGLEEGEKGKVRPLRFGSGFERERMFAIRDGLLGLKEGETDSQRRNIKKLLKKGYNLDEVAGLSATHEIAPGYTELVQGLKQKINTDKSSKIDKPFARIFEQVITGQKPTKGFKYGDKFYQDINEVVKLYNKDAATYGKKYNIDVPLIEYDPRPGKKINPKNFLPNFKYLSPAAQANVTELANRGIGVRTDAFTMNQLENIDLASDTKTQAKLLRKMGFKCKFAGKKGGLGSCDDPASYTDDINKTRADLKSNDVTVRAAANAKLNKGLQIAKTLPTIGKFLRRVGQATIGGVSKALQVTGLGTPVGLAIEGMVEGGIYDYYRKKGYTHDQAYQEGFITPLLTGRPDGVPWYGGAESLLEKELIGDPQQNKKVAQYVSTLKDQDQVYDAFGRLQQGQQASRKDIIDAAQADIRDLNKSGTISNIDRIMNPESMASRAYQTAVETQTGKQAARSKAYKDENYMNQDTTQDFDDKLQKKRDKAMLEMFPMYTPEVIDSMYEKANIEKPENFSIDAFNNVMRDQDKMNYFAENFRLEKASGGIASLTKTIPPESGPTPHGLPYVYNNVKKI